MHIPVHSRTHSLRATLFAAVAALMLVGCNTPPNQVLRLQAREAIEKKDYPRAEELMTLALQQDAADWKAHYYMGLVRLSQGRPLDARLHLENAYSLREDWPETPDVLDALAEAYWKEGDNEKLYNLLKMAGTRYGTTRDYLRQADFFSRSGDVDGAKEAYAKAAQFADPKDSSPHMKAAAFFEKIGDRKHAYIALQHAQQIEPQNRLIAAKMAAIQAGRPSPSVVEIPVER